MEILTKYLPFLIPIIMLQFALGITALVHVLKHPHYRFGTKTMWIFIVLCIGFIGAIVYFVFGRGEDI